MKYLIINADDFGYTHSINTGILEGISKGIITSTSLMVLRKYSEEVRQIADNDNISIGLHYEKPNNINQIQEEFLKQVDLFEALVGRKPDHIDSHKIKPKSIVELNDVLEKYSKENSTPIRDWGHANFIESFFGLNLDGSGELDASKVTPSSLINVLNSELREGYNELMCHAGYVDEELMQFSSYNKLRENELKTLLSNEVKHYLATSEIKLVSWNDVKL